MARLFIDIEARFAQFQDALDKVAGSTARTAATLDRSFSGVTSTVRGLVAALGVFQGVRFAKGLLDGADQLEALSGRTKIAIADLAGLKFAAEQSDTTLEALATGVQKLRRSISDAGTGDKAKQGLFEALGLKDAAKGSEDALETLLKLADVFPRLTPNDQTRVAMELMGKSAAELLPAFEKGRAGLEAFIKRGKELNPEIERIARSASDFNDKMNEAGTAIRGALLPFVERATPALKDLATELTKSATAAGRLGTVLAALLKLPFNLIEGAPKVGVQITEERIAQLQRQKAALDRALDPNSPATSRRDLDLTKLENRRAAVIKEIEMLQARTIPQDMGDATGFDLTQQRKPTIKLPGPDVSKNKLEEQLKGLETAFDAEKHLFDQRNTLLRANFEAGNLAFSEMTEARKSILQKFLGDSESLINQEIAALEKFKKASSDPKERIEVQTKINELIAKRAKLQQDASVATVTTFFEDEKAARAFLNSLKDIDAQLFDLQGKTAKAVLIRFDVQTEDLRRRLQAEAKGGDPTAVANLAKLDKVRSLTEVGAGLGELETRASQIKAQLEIEEGRVQNSLRTGSISELEAMAKTGEARKRAVAQLEQIVANLEAVARASENPALVLQADQARAALERLRSESDLLGQKFESIFTGSFADAFSGFIDGTKNARQAFDSFAGSVVQQINRLVAEELGKKLFQSLGMGGTASGGGLAGLFSGFFSGGGGEAAALADGTIAGFAEGTPYVPRTGLALIHKGERIVTAEDNARGNWGGGMTYAPTFVIPAPTDKRTQSQIANRAYEGLQRAAARR